MTSRAVSSTLSAGFEWGVANASCTFGATPVGSGLLCQSPKSPPSFWLSNWASWVVPFSEKNALAVDVVVKVRAPFWSKRFRSCGKIVLL